MRKRFFQYLISGLMLLFGLLFLLVHIKVFYYNHPQLITGVIPSDLQNELVRLFYLSGVPFVALIFGSFFTYKANYLGWGMLNFFFLFYLIGPVLTLFEDSFFFNQYLLENAVQILISLLFVLVLHKREVVYFYNVKQSNHILMGVVITVMCVYMSL